MLEVIADRHGGTFLPETEGRVQWSGERRSLGLPNYGRRRLWSIRSRLWRDLALVHDCRAGASACGFVYPAVHDLHTLQVLLDDFLTNHFDVLFRVAS